MLTGVVFLYFNWYTGDAPLPPKIHIFKFAQNGQEVEKWKENPLYDTCSKVMLKENVKVLDIKKGLVKISRKRNLEYRSQV